MKDFFKNIKSDPPEELPPPAQKVFDDNLANNNNMGKETELLKKAQQAVGTTLENKAKEKKLRATLKELNWKYFSEQKNPE